MERYYFFGDITNIRKIEKWFEKNTKDRVILEYCIPVTFTINKTTYSTKYVEESDYIYCDRLHGEEIRESHKYHIIKIEKFLNKLKQEDKMK